MSEIDELKDLIEKAKELKDNPTVIKWVVLAWLIRKAMGILPYTIGVATGVISIIDLIKASYGF